MFANRLKNIGSHSRMYLYNEQDLYKEAFDFPWDDYFTSNETFAIDSVVFGELFTHSLYVSQKRERWDCRWFSRKSRYSSLG